MHPAAGPDPALPPASFTPVLSVQVLPPTPRPTRGETPVPGRTPTGASSRSPQPGAFPLCAGLMLKIQNAQLSSPGQDPCPAPRVPRSASSWQSPSPQAAMLLAAQSCDPKYPIPPLCSQGLSWAGDNGAAGRERGVQGAAADAPEATKVGCSRAGARGSSGGLPGHPTATLPQLTPGERAGERNVPPRRSGQGREPPPQPEACGKTSEIKPSAGSLMSNKQQHRRCCE